MRLKAIKLAGFKSFVDPSTVTLQTNLTAIVGPNGCGKSNIVDAIRWVIGESSAKQLRGGLMTDVIFNGTTQRKPVGQAAIELLFDNSQASLQGPYAQYAEITIRREITREGQSQFYFNGSRCRRRDILDLFLGTGLGPNSYAIIEQGMISQLIEGKPEEIRVYLEEAAGISKYRERRRETENRIQGTRDNLARLTDVRLELEKQLETLKRQANAAERYKTLKQEHRQVKAEWHALNCRLISAKLTANAIISAEKSTGLETAASEQQALLAEIEQQQLCLSQSNEAHNAVQARYYEMTAEITQHEQRIHYIQQQQAQIEQDLKQIANNQEESETHLLEDKDSIEQLTAEVESLLPQSQQAGEEAENMQQQWQQAEQERLKWQDTWDQFQTEYSRAEQKLQVEKSRLQHLRQKCQETENRLSRLQQQRQELDLGSLPQEIEQLTANSSELQAHMEKAQQQLADYNQQLQSLRETRQSLQNTREQKRQELQKLSRQQATLEALQQAALGKADEAANEWLQQQGWAEKARLLEGIEVSNGWETAAETVLGPYLEAICTDQVSDLAQAAHNCQQGRLTLYLSKEQAEKTRSTGHNLALLAEKISSKWPIQTLINGIYLAETLDQALENIDQLAEEESIVTKDGLWFGSCWLRINKIKDPSTGILQRKHLLSELEAVLSRNQQELQALENQLEANQTKLAQLEEKRELQQRQYREQSSEHSELRSALSGKQARLEQLNQRLVVSQQELAQQEQLLADTRAQLETCELSSQQAEDLRATLSSRREEMLQQRQTHTLHCQTLRQKMQLAKQAAEELQIRLSSSQNQLHILHQNISRTEKQLTQLQERQDDLLLRQTEAGSPLPDLQENHSRLLGEKASSEAALRDAKAQVTELENHLHQLEKKRRQLEAMHQALRDELANIGMEQSSLKAHFENHQQPILESDFNLEALSEALPEDAQPEAWQQRLSQIENRIQRLGAINLAAIDEHNTVLERKTYLDSQNEDLCQALATLEEAIRKIDRESQSRLKDTFERANSNFMNLYQSMFPGGHAELEFTGEELLTAGIIIRAQPPGKRNTMLHLLSGGEKALTAIALVFALFQLNPAPFCVLDEVDAPLDDANVGRFCRLVQTMSSSVQFLYISHNKVAMEMAEQLVGITMQEPGVSRMVTVDINEALTFVE